MYRKVLCKICLCFLLICGALLFFVQPTREAAMALTPDQVIATAAAARSKDGATLTNLRRALRDQISVSAAVLHLGGWHLQRFGGDSKLASKLSASPFATSFALRESVGEQDTELLPGLKLAQGLLDSGLVMTYPNEGSYGPAT